MKDYEQEKKRAINDILSVMGDTKMYVNEKKLYINAIDILYNLDYYEDGSNSLYKEFR